MAGSRCNIKVTILCLTYNHEKFIRDCLDGFVKQKTRFPFEAIVVDDASTDTTPLIVREYARSYPNIIKPIYKPVHNHLSGLREILDHLFASVQSEYVAMCDGDDYWTDHFQLQKQVDFLDTHPEYVVCYHNAVIINEAGEKIADSILGAEDKKDFSGEELMFVPRVLKQTMCFRRVFSGLPEEFYQVCNGDRFVVGLLGQYGRGKYLGDVVRPAVYRQHAQSMWSSLTDMDQEVTTLNTRLWLYFYYVRCVSQDFALRFLYEKIFLYMLSIKKNPNQILREREQIITQRLRSVQEKERQLKSIKYLLKQLWCLFPRKIKTQLVKWLSRINPLKAYKFF